MTIDFRKLFSRTQTPQSEPIPGSTQAPNAAGGFAWPVADWTRLVVVGMVSNGFTIADPNDAGMLDVVGFDTGTPSVISDFARGRPP